MPGNITQTIHKKSAFTCFAILIFSSALAKIELCIGFEPNAQDALESIADHPLKRMVHLEKAFLNRCVKLSAIQANALSKITIESESSANGEILEGELVDPNNALRARQSVRNFEKAIQGILSPAQKTTYLAEKAAREQFIRETKSLGVALFFDQKLSFTVNQLKAFQKDLAAWSGIKNIEIDAYEKTSSMVPVINESILIGNLTKPQLDSLSSYRQISIAIDSSRDEDLFAPILIAH